MLKKLLSFSLFFVLLLFFPNAPGVAQMTTAKATVWEVYPTMSRLYIQAVVDSASNGDTVYFHAGTYDWSGAPIYPRYANEGAINIIDKTLTIKGEPGNLIKGPDTVGTGLGQCGLQAFQVLDEDTNNDVTFMGLNIQHFMRGVVASHLFGALPDIPEYTIPNAKNVTVINCMISDIARVPIVIQDPTGNVSIENNIISQAPTGVFLVYRGPGFTYWQPDNSRVNISGNTITSCPGAGLYAERTKNFRVENNSISLPSFSLWSDGIQIYGAKKGTVLFANSITNNQAGIVCYGPSENVIIDKNKVSCIFPNSCWGIQLWNDSPGYTVTRNEINLTSGSGIGIYSEGNHSLYGQNKISGSGRAAVCLSGYDYSGGTGLPTYAHHDLFLGNDVSQFTPSEAHYYLDYGTHENLIIGLIKSPWTYIDYGVNNIIIGGTNITGTGVQALSAVRQSPGQEFKEARKNILF